MFRLKLANHEFLINNRFPYVERLCRDYTVPLSGAESVSDAGVISASQKELEFENKEGGAWSDAYLESLAIYRKLCERLLSDDILLFHGSAVELDGRAYLFAGRSGAGKSTHRGLWQERFGKKLTVINDDKPLLAFRDDEIRVFGTPYAGKDSLQTNTNAKVCGFLFIKQAKANSVRRLLKKEALPLLLNQIYRVNDKAGVVKTLDLALRLAEIPAFELSCTISAEAVEIAYNALKNT